MTDRNRSRVLSTRGVRGLMPRSPRAIPRKRGDEKMGKKMRRRTRHQDAAETRTALGGWRAGTRLASKGPSWSKEMCFWRPWGNRPWNMGAGAMTMSGQWPPRSGQLSAWSQRDVLVAGPPTQKKAPAVIFLSRLPPPPPLYSTHRSPSFDTLSRRPSSVLHSIAHHRITPFSIPHNLSTSWPTLSSSSRPLAL